MLAYVFWHQPIQEVAPATYEEYLCHFHATLLTQSQEGLLHSAVLRATSLPWAAEQRSVYEDWYLLDSSAALDTLNQTAISVPCAEPHQRIAQLAAWGSGGLYRLYAGAPDFTGMQTALWFAKPAGMSYTQFDRVLAGLLEQREGALWQRQMTLGPALEFCWHTSSATPIPPGFGGLRITPHIIWSSHR
jgi:hypothetical protein